MASQQRKRRRHIFLRSNIGTHRNISAVALVVSGFSHDADAHRIGPAERAGFMHAHFNMRRVEFDQRQARDLLSQLFHQKKTG